MVLPLEEAATVAASLFDHGASPEAARTKLTATWHDRGIDVGTLVFEGGTAVSRQAGPPPSQRMATLPSLVAPGPDGAQAQFEIGDVLGEGGMGVVRIAEQVALRRQVAIKTLRPGAGSHDAPQLLKEARVTGVLEHPNVVPVYALGRDDADRPLLVMRRIAGDDWRTLLEEADGDRLSDAYLRKHLAILKQVALAAHFAHSKGIVHRDLKPGNVMVGGFGEVYVVDWGVAVSLKQDVPGIPWVGLVTEIEGTPGYMAPEMAAAESSLIDARTDVYLLGAMLHEILTGDTPHTGDNLVDVLTHAFASAPRSYPPSIPSDLARIAKRAMRRHREERFESAQAFAEALDEFIVHRSSTLFSDEAAMRLSEAQTILASEGGRTGVVEDEAERERLYGKFSACRFAFTQALRSWPENEAAVDGLQQTLILLIEHELHRDALLAAQGLAVELPRPDPALRERIEAAIRAREEKRRRLEELAHDADMTVGAGTRKAISFALASSWGVACIAAGLLAKAGVWVITHNGFAVLAAIFAALTLASTRARQDSVLTTAFNRSLVVMTALNFTGFAAVWVFAGLAALPTAHTFVFMGIVGVLTWTAVGLIANRAYTVVAYGDALAIVLVLTFPKHCFELYGITAGSAAVLASFRAFDRSREAAAEP